MNRDQRFFARFISFLSHFEISCVPISATLLATAIINTCRYFEQGIKTILQHQARGSNQTILPPELSLLTRVQTIDVTKLFAIGASEEKRTKTKYLVTEGCT